MVERLDPEQLGGTSEESVRAFIESDFRIRQGLCPNGCGLLHEDNGGQCCERCSFWTKKPAEKSTPQ